MFNFRDNDETNEAHQEMMKWLIAIYKQAFNTAERVRAIEEFCQAMFSSDKETIQQKRVANLIKLYSAYLVEIEKLLEKDALARAKFEVSNFDNDEILEEINRKYKFEQEGRTRSEYLESQTYENDINNFWTTGNTQTNKRWIAPYDLFAPVYNLVKGHRYKEGQKVCLDYDANKDYYNFIKYRAIVRNLVKLGILSKIEEKDFEGNKMEPSYKLKIVDIDEIGKVIYDGERHGHDNEYFDEKLAKNDLPNIFRLSFGQD